MTVYAPASYRELDSMLSIAVREKSGPVALRYPRGGEGEYTDDHSREDSTLLRSGDDITIVTYGISVNAALSAADRLSDDGIRAEVIKLNRLLPLAPETVRESLRKTGRFIMVEEACRSGSLGTLLLSDAAVNGVLLRGARLLDLGRGVVPHGSVSQLQHCLHLDAEGVVAAAKEIMCEKDPA